MAPLGQVTLYFTHLNAKWDGLVSSGWWDAVCTDTSVQSSCSKEIKLEETFQLLSFQESPTAHLGVRWHLLPIGAFPFLATAEAGTSKTLWETRNSTPALLHIQPQCYNAKSYHPNQTQSPNPAVTTTHEASQSTGEPRGKSWCQPSPPRNAAEKANAGQNGAFITQTTSCQHRERPSAHLGAT